MQTTAIRVARGLVWLIYAWLLATITLLFLAFILLLFGANPEAGFVEWVYRSVSRAMAPFRGIFEPVVLTDQSVFDVSMLFAMVVYLFVALGLNAAVDWISGRLQVAERQELIDRQAAAQAASTAQPTGPARILQLVGPTGAATSAVLTPYRWGTSVELSAAGLDPVRLYTAWIDTIGGARVALGAFQPDADGTASLSLTATTTLADAAGFGLSQGPTAGEAGPSDVLRTALVS